MDHSQVDNKTPLIHLERYESERDDCLNREMTVWIESGDGTWQVDNKTPLIHLERLQGSASSTYVLRKHGYPSS